MDWIPALLKHLNISRLFVVAAFMVSVVMYAVPRVAPEFVDPVPKELNPAVVAVLVGTGFLLSVWSISAIWAFAKSAWAAVGALFAKALLNQRHQQLLLALGKNPRGSLDLDKVDYERLDLTQLEVLELVDQLQRAGLVSTDIFSPEQVSLTKMGQRQALKIHRQAVADAA